MITMILLLSMSAAEAENVPQQTMLLEQLQACMPKSPPWEKWLRESGELPPDFDALPSMAELPDPLLITVNGQPARISAPDAWAARRQELLALFKHWIIGSVPPPPDNLEAAVLSEHEQTEATVRAVELRFGPDHQAKLNLELMIPRGTGPFPVFMTQDNHRQWALIALRRGYLACVYAGADSRDDTDTFLAAYPDYDWSKLTRRGWAASRCIDYLASVPQARMDQIALTGHSRNGKTSLIASALDERIAVVISSSSGVGGCMPSRYCGEPHFSEGIENITRAFPDWFHPRWRFFVGREHKMPVDLHELAALSAPRPCLLSIALNDSVESSWAMEKAYLSVKPVYALFGAEERLRILWRPGGHETWTATIERYVDWCDLQFGRGQYAFPERLIHPRDWETWSKAPGNALDPAAFPARGFTDPRPETATREAWESRRNTLRNDVRQMLGAPAPSAPSAMADYGKEPEHIEKMLSRSDTGPKLEKQDLVFGAYINGDVFMPKGAREAPGKIPALLWLHPLSNPKGYVASYARGEQAFRTFAQAGYAVFCYDQLGCGRRIEEAEGFYTRYPDGSLLGHMVQDAQAALDALAGLPYVDRDQIYVVGYGLGAMIALHLAALDDRPAGYALVSPPPPFRLDTNTAETGGIRRWAHVQMLLPRLGFFTAHEPHVPYDIDELLAAMAPHPLLMLTPRYDRETPLPMAQQSAAAARKIYALHGQESRLTQETPDTYNHFDTTMQKLVVDWLKQTPRNP